MSACKNKFFCKAIIAFAALLPVALFAQLLEPEWTHPELKWSSLETGHFYVHFHNGAEQTAKLTAKIAEEVYAPITSLYGYQPDGKIHFVIIDYEDVSNGAAFYLDNKVEIWASAMDFELRGTHNWLRNVITHEFTHMISLGAARKLTRHIPAAYVQWIGYEDEKRDDVLYGYPNRIVSYPIPFTVMPPWFAEGVAQYQRSGLDYDTWDSHRDMLTRTATVENKLLSYDEMNVFGKNSIGSERVYNQGYSLSSFIAKHYGEGALQKISNNMRSPLRYSFNRAIKKAVGKSGSDLYEEWKKSREENYAQRLRTIQANKVEGELLEREGTGNFYPRWSPDGRTLAYLTNQGGDFLGQTALVTRDLASKKLKALKAGVHYSLAWSADGEKILYSRKSTKNPHHRDTYDLYVYDLASHDEERLTYNARAHSPHWSPDGKSVACVVNHDGTSNLAVFDLAPRQLKMLTSHKNQEQVYLPQWSPDGKKILFSQSRGRGRALHWYEVATGEITPVDLNLTNGAGEETASASDSRDAVFSPDGRRIFFSWDRTGIFNIYALDLASNEISQLTNVIGGAFMPSVNANGELAYSTFAAEGYKIAQLTDPRGLSFDLTHYLPDPESQILLASRDGKLASDDLGAIKHGAYDDRNLPNYEVKPYHNHYTSIAILPRLVFDYGTTKLGSYFYSGDMLNKYNFLAGAAINTKKDYDLFLLFDYKKFGPTLFLEAYNQVRHSSGFEQDLGDLKFRYNLMEFDLGAQFTLGNHHVSRFALIYNRYNAGISFVDRGVKQSLGYTYYDGKIISFQHRHDARQRALDTDINPRSGRTVHVRYDLEFNDFISSDEPFVLTDFGTFTENFVPQNTHRAQLDWTERFTLPGRTGLSLTGRGGLLTREVDSFFYFFAGGLDGVRGYPYYSMEGRYLLHGRATYRFPLWRKINFSLLNLYFDKIYLAAAYDYGGAFDKTKGFSNKLHDSVNLQLRADLFSFYGFPTRLGFDAAYGFDQFTNARTGITYGKEWRYYFTLAFDFLDE